MQHSPPMVGGQAGQQEASWSGATEGSSSGPSHGSANMLHKAPSAAQGLPNLVKSPSTGKPEVSEPLIPPQKVAQFVHLVTGGEKCEPDVFQLLSSIGTEFVVGILDEACQVARLRDSRTLEPEDLRMILEKYHYIHLPPAAPSSEAIVAQQPLPRTHDVHLKRLGQIRQHQYLSNVTLSKSQQLPPKPASAAPAGNASLNAAPLFKAPGK